MSFPQSLRTLKISFRLENEYNVSQLKTPLVTQFNQNIYLFVRAKLFMNAMWSEREKAIWLACTLDGEGNINYSIQKKGQKGPTAWGNVSVSNTNQEFIDRYVEFLDYFKVPYKIYPGKAHKYYTQPEQKLWKACAQVFTSTKGVIVILRIILPFLTKNRAKAQEFIDGYEQAQEHKNWIEKHLLLIMQEDMYYSTTELTKMLEKPKGSIYIQLKKLELRKLVESSTRISKAGATTTRVSWWKKTHD